MYIYSKYLFASRCTSWLLLLLLCRRVALRCMLPELASALTLALVAVALYLTQPLEVALSLALALALVPLARLIPDRWAIALWRRPKAT